jgi:hypothetical protein
MLSQQALDWIKEQLQQGYTKTQIKEALTARGYSPSDADAALNSQNNLFAVLCLIFSFLVPPISIIFGIMSIKQIVKENTKGKGLTFAGMLISTVPYVLINAFFLFYFGSLNVVSLLITVGIPLVIVLLGFFNINNVMKKGTPSFVSVYVFGVLFMLIFPLTLGSLVFFGALSPNELVSLPASSTAGIASEKLTADDAALPDKCSVGPPAIISCTGWQINSSGQLKLTLRYDFGDYALSDFTMSVGKACTPSNFNFEVGAEYEFTCEIPKANPGERYKKSLLIQYKDNENIPQEIPGTVLVTYR